MLSVAVAVTIVVSRRSDAAPPARVVHARVTADALPFLTDRRVRAELTRHHVDLRLDVVARATVALTAALPATDFVLTEDATDTAELQRHRPPAGASTVFTTPVVVVARGDALRSLGDRVAHDHGGFWTIDMRQLLALRPRGVSIATANADRSGASALYAAIAGYVANGNRVLADQADVDRVVNAISPLFVNVGDTALTSRALLDEFLTGRLAATPAAITYEADVAERGARGVTIAYPDPSAVAERSMVPFTRDGADVVALFARDKTLRKLAGEHGLHGAPPAAVPNVPLPSYDTLHALSTTLAAIQHTAPSKGTS